MEVISKGDLAYIPSQVTLLAFTNKVVSKATMTTEPSIVLVIGGDEKGYRIIHSGSEWWVSRDCIYSVDVNELKEHKNVGNFNRGL